MGKPTKSAKRNEKGRKNHGPKRRMFHDYNKAMRVVMEQYNLLNKYNCRESFNLACQDRGFKSPTDAMWIEFCSLKSRAAKDEWLKNLKK